MNKTANNMKRRIPNFKSEDEEPEFWATRDSTQYLDWSKARRVVLSSLKPSVKTISLRLPESMIEELMLLANKRDIPYQSLLKVFLAERIEKELRVATPRHRPNRRFQPTPKRLPSRSSWKQRSNLSQSSRPHRWKAGQLSRAA